MPSTTEADLCLSGGAIHLWRIALDGGTTGAAGEPLSDDEQERAGRLRFEVDRSAFRASRAALRVILGRYLGVGPAAVRFAYDGRGKPSIVDGGDLSFSLSRSRPVAVVAVTRGRAVGVDVERIRPEVDIDAVARHFLSPAEAEALSAAPGPGRLADFFACWARKEAMVKAIGAGLGDGRRPLVTGPEDGGPFTVRSVDVGPGTAAAVAVEGPMGAIRLLDVGAVGLKPPGGGSMGWA